MDTELKELLDKAAALRVSLQNKGLYDASGIIKRMILEISGQYATIDSCQDVIRKQAKELRFLRSAATEQARIIKDLKERMMDDGR